MSYVYLKKEKQPLFRRPGPFVKRFLALSLFAFGLIIFSSAVLPIVKFQLQYSLKFGQLLSPLSPKFYNRSHSILGDITTDYTQLSNWFVADPAAAGTPQKSPATIAAGLSAYTITIPKVKVAAATVLVGSFDLKKSLIQYPQTALPGQLGNTVVFGHSVLPQFFNPKSYLTIFSTLFKLKPGDEILVDYDHITYKYLVEELYEVQPTDLSVLEQRFDARYLTLITCSPPGTYLRRLIIKARIVDI